MWLPALLEGVNFGLNDRNIARCVLQSLAEQAMVLLHMHTGNPCDSREVSTFLKWSDKEQLQGSMQTKRAALFDVAIYCALQKRVLQLWSSA
jgi:hypothetical protein